MRLTIPEVLDAVSKANSHAEKVHILKVHETFGLRSILQALFNPQVSFALPDGAPPYRADPAPIGHNPSSLERQMSKFKYLVNGPDMTKSPMKREEIFITILEAVHPSEAELVIQMKDKINKYDGITDKVVWDAFPGIVPEPVKKSRKVKQSSNE
jgi:hypothetical protein